MGETTYRKAIRALGRGFLSTRPGVTLSASGAVPHWHRNLLAGTDAAWFQAELEAGDGRELTSKFRAAHSSSALAVNTFARFKTAPEALSIGGRSGFETIQFEAKCPVGIDSRGSPHLDVLLRSAAVVVGIESKCTEHLTPHVAAFSPVYDLQITDWRRDTAWFRLMHELIAEPERYCYLDTAQLVKHAFGLARCFEGEDVSLVYVFWEPRNADDVPELRRHRDEVARLTDEVSGSTPTFSSISYRQLWNAWQSITSPSWLTAHVAALRERYDVEI